MVSTIGGDDPLHDLSPEEKDRKEKKLRKEARDLRRRGKHKDGRKKESRATEISRAKSKRAHQ